MVNYTFIQKILHRIYLSNELIKKTTFDIENLIFKTKNQNLFDKQHVFITGLPRSGTTALLNFIYDQNFFASLTYADMPFILSPNLWNLLSINKKELFNERVHGDGIKYSLNSPEAFDEVFWKTFDELEAKENFAKYIFLILKKYKKERYLSKNNNNYKRINKINSIFPNSVFLITFRDPLQQALSLFNQHKNFINLQKKDGFILNYMDWLGHNEFGLNYIRWNNSIDFIDTLNINHWLEQWYLFYYNIINNIKDYDKNILISYEDLCMKKKLLTKLSGILGIELNLKENYFFLSKKNINLKYDNNLLLKCRKIYEELILSKHSLDSFNL